MIKELSQRFNPIDLFLPIFEIILLSQLAQKYLLSLPLFILVAILFLIALELKKRDSDFLTKFQNKFTNHKEVISFFGGLALCLIFTLGVFTIYHSIDSTMPLSLLLIISVTSFFWGIISFYQLNSQTSSELQQPKTILFSRFIVVLQGALIVAAIDHFLLSQLTQENFAPIIKIIFLLSISLITYYPIRLLEQAYSRNKYQFLSYLISIVLVGVI